MPVSASPKIIAIVQNQGADWYAVQVVRPIIENHPEDMAKVREHIAGFPEPLRSECCAAVDRLEVS